MSKKPYTKRVENSARKKADKFHSRIIIFFMILWILHYKFLEHKTIGKDSRYFLYIVLLPTLIGSCIISYYSRGYIKSFLKDSKGWFQNLAAVILLFLLGLITSYITFGLVADAAWNYWNKKTADDNPERRMYCPVTSLKKSGYSRTTSSNYYLNFKFNGRSEHLNINYQQYKYYQTEDLKNYELELSVRKGVWNYYIVESWNLNTMK